MRYVPGLMLLGLAIEGFFRPLEVTSINGISALVWKDGTEMPIEDGKGDKSFEQRSFRRSLASILSW